MAKLFSFTKRLPAVEPPPKVVGFRVESVAPRQQAPARRHDVAARLQAMAVLRGLTDAITAAWVHRGRRDAFVKAMATLLPGYDHATARPVRALIGPAASGKTTTVARLATHAVLRGARVVIVSVDHVRLAAFDQVRRVAALLGCPHVCARSRADLDRALQELPADASVLVDTAGQAAHEGSDLATLLAAFPRDRLETLLVLPCNMAPHDLLFWPQRLESFSPRGLVLTRTDEAQRLGALFNLPYLTRIPLAYAGFGASLVRGSIMWTPAAHAELAASEDSSSVLSRLVDEQMRPLAQAAQRFQGLLSEATGHQAAALEVEP